MNTPQNLSDKAAIGISIACSVHCLLLPLVITFIPSTLLLTLSDESFHILLIVAVIPLSILGLSMGCNKHKDYRVLILGLIGLSSLILGVILGHDLLGEIGEKGLTLFGSIFIASSHLLNYKLCRAPNPCECHD